MKRDDDKRAGSEPTYSQFDTTNRLRNRVKKSDTSARRDSTVRFRAYYDEGGREKKGERRRGIREKIVVGERQREYPALIANAPFIIGACSDRV